MYDAPIKISALIMLSFGNKTVKESRKVIFNCDKKHKIKSNQIIFNKYL
jgi:hypothetical protein